MTRALHWLEQARSAPGPVAETLLRASDPEEARLAAFALRRVGAVAELGRAAGAEEPGVRAAVLDVLEAMPEATGVLEERLDDEPAPWLQRRLARALLAREPGRAPVLALDARGPVRAAALTARPEVSRPEHLDDVLPEVAWWAAVSRVRAPDPAWAEALRAASGHRDAFVGAQIVRALRAIGVAVDGPDLDRVPLDLEGVRALDDRRVEDVQRAALCLGFADAEPALLGALGRLAASSEDIATEAIVKATRHPVEGVARTAVRALDGRVGAAVWQAYADRVARAPDPELQVDAVWTVARRREPEAQELVVRWASGASGPVREAAVDGLLARVQKTRQARDAAARDVLVRRLVDGSVRERRDAARALGRFHGDADVVATLRGVRDDPAIAEDIAASLKRLS